MMEPGESVKAMVGTVEALRQSYRERQIELAYLIDNLEKGLELVSNLDLVNSTLAESVRPDLVIKERAEMMPVGVPSDLRRTNNFSPNWSSFGIAVYRDRENTLTKETEPEYVGRRTFTDEERKVFFTLSGRGGYDDTLDFAESNDIDKKMARSAALTHASKEAFMRMWILMPEFTERLMDVCLDQPDSRHKSINEEIFVAYQIMSRLVDTDDKYVRRPELANDGQTSAENGFVDSWYLCR